MPINYEYATPANQPIKAATVTRFVTPSGDDREVTITRGKKNGQGRVLLDFHDGNPKMIVSDSELDNFIEALEAVRAGGVA